MRVGCLQRTTEDVSSPGTVVTAVVSPLTWELETALGSVTAVKSHC